MKVRCTVPDGHPLNPVLAGLSPAGAGAALLAMAFAWHQRQQTISLKQPTPPPSELNAPSPAAVGTVRILQLRDQAIRDDSSVATWDEMFSYGPEL